MDDQGHAVGTRSLTLREGCLGGALLLAGLAAAGAIGAYDSSNWKMAVALNAWGALVSFLALAAGLTLFGVTGGRRLAAGLFGFIPWNTFLLSQLPYMGFFMMPLEVLASALILRAVAPLRQRWKAFVLAAVVRALAQVLIYAVRPAARALFPGAR